MFQMERAKTYLRHGGRLVAGVSVAALLTGISTASATVILGSDLAGFAVLGGSEVTNVPTSTIVGSVGVYAGTSITGFNSSPGISVSDLQVTGGSVDTTTATGSTDNAMLAQSQLTTAIGILNGLLPTSALANPTLGGAGQPSLGPGTYTGAANVTGAFTLQGNGTPDEMWVFLTDGLTFNIGSSVTINDPGLGASVYWVDASSVSIDSDVANPTTLLGNILALTSIFVGADATDSCGRFLAGTAVTLISDTIENDCTSAGLPEILAGSGGLSGTSESSGGGTGTPVPEPSTLTLVGASLLGLLGLAARQRRVRLPQGSRRAIPARL